MGKLDFLNLKLIQKVLSLMPFLPIVYMYAFRTKCVHLKQCVHIKFNTC